MVFGAKISFVRFLNETKLLTHEPEIYAQPNQENRS